MENTKEKQKEPVVYKEPVKKVKEVWQIALVDVEKIVSTFNLQIELSKLKFSIPFNELLRNRVYRNKILDMVRIQGDFHNQTSFRVVIYGFYTVGNAYHAQNSSLVVQ